MSAVIERALASAITYTDDVEVVVVVVDDVEVAALEAEAKRLDALHGSLLPMEESARRQVANKREELLERLKAIRGVNGFKLPMLDPTVLAWTKTQKAWFNIVSRQLLNVPVFAFLPIEHDQAKIVVSGSGIESINAPDFVRAQYRTMARDLAQHCSRSWDGTGRRNITLSYSYAGVVPDDIREIIHRERTDPRFTDLALICEVDEWTIDSQVVPRPPRMLDPILVGVGNDALWVLGSFDPTSTEDYIAREFTS